MSFAQIMHLAQITDYKGGTNPLLVFLFIGVIVLSVLLGVLYLAWAIYKRVKFNLICSEVQLTGKESGMLKTFIKRFRIKQPLLVLIRRNHLDAFINQVSHYLANTEISDEELKEEIEIFNHIREKLNLKHNFKSRKLTSSRCLPKSMNLIAYYFDSITDNRLEFNSVILDNSDLFLAISPPKDPELHQHLKEIKKPQLEVSFIRERDAEYHFDSCVYKILDEPEKIFYIQHSNNVTQGRLHTPLDLPASIIHHAQDGVKEHEAIIELIDSKTSTFFLKEQKIHLKKGSGVLINTSILDKSLALQGTISKLIKRGQTLYHRAELKNLSEEINRFLLKFSFDLDSETKQNKKKRAHDKNF